MVQLIKENGSILGFLNCVSCLQCTTLPICTIWSLLALPEILCASICELMADTCLILIKTGFKKLSKFTQKAEMHRRVTKGRTETSVCAGLTVIR